MCSLSFGGGGGGGKGVGETMSWGTSPMVEDNYVQSIIFVRWNL